MDKITGPKKSPRGPIKRTPPNIAKKIIIGCSFSFVPTKIGLKKLSARFITVAPNKKRTIAFHQIFLIAKIIEAGIHTTGAPTNGIKQIRIVTPPQKIGEGNPKIAKITPKSVP